ncbi:MAG: RHS repeat-associated core domain-containing protein [Rhodanobacter sp.]|jgi:RHS repeat-associated protein|uniref:RHS repeat-associated core domain-containing protein n=1 Tax=Rhodanobacter sp. KK11 TaxID=3083255 RepID=UPI002967377A|nr:RHS repeat-associated core domain-containing protein [Rhodanobacter sp. KK11]MDW2980137.1 RHS repeat-associated core domain-containing protein [Rhodanobacter sp. KK11]
MKKELLAIGVAVMASGACHAQQHKVTYIYTDPQGTPLAEADESGNITATYDYAPYGTPAPNMSGAPNGPGYTGHVNDPETGLVYMQARYYDPAIGRFLSVDPDAPKEGNVFNFNRFEYVNNNPVVNIDPTGKIIQIAGDPAFTAKMNNDIAMIDQGPGGHVLIEKMRNTPNIIYIVPAAPGAGNSTQADPSGISANGKGTGSTIKIDTTQTTGGMDSTGNKTRPEFVGVSHEFGHGRAIDQGVQSYDKGNGAPGTTPPSEIHSMANENMVRREHNIPIRPAYNDPKPPPPPPPPKPPVH